MIDKKDDRFLADNIKGLMMTVLGRWNAQMDQARETTEFAAIRESDMRVFGQLRGRTLKLSALHRELGMSRQAAQQAVARLVEHGVLQVTLAKDSKRDKVVSVTETGQELRSLAARQIRDIEAQSVEAIGVENTAVLRDLLRQLGRQENGR
ncbi:MAG: MarR family transcriptional regulator [Shimia sp.]|uniref:hypothetical protein n=1 Tax=Shimia sp. TaxID=1954381 RepID=UPI003B8C1A54